MAQTNDNPEPKAWVEPEIRELDIRETFTFPNTGGDGSIFPDCTRS